MSRTGRAKTVAANERDTRERLLATALALVAKHGYAGTSIAMICEEAGLSASSIYWFFDNKEDLFLSAIEQGAREFLDAVAVDDAAGEATTIDTDSLITTVARRLERNADFLRLILIMMLEDPHASPEVRDKIADIRAASLAWWTRFLVHVFAPLGRTTAEIFAADFAPLCRATVNGAFVAREYGEPVDIGENDAPARTAAARARCAGRAGSLTRVTSPGVPSDVHSDPIPYPVNPVESPHPRSFWLDEALAEDEVHGIAHAPALDSDIRADVCIVGGGYTGLWTALDLKAFEPSIDVVLIEKDVCGSGASGRNAGFLLSLWAKFTSLVKVCGEGGSVSHRERVRGIRHGRDAVLPGQRHRCGRPVRRLALGRDERRAAWFVERYDRGDRAPWCVADRRVVA